MAFPVIEGQATSVSASKQTSHGVNLPSGIQADELLVIIFNVDGDGPPPPVITTPSGWTSGGTSGNQYTQSVVFYKQASGSEGSTVSVSIDKANTMSAWCCRISGWNSVELSTVNFNLFGSSSPSSNSITPSWGADDTLWLYLAATGDDDQLMTAYPSGFTGQTSNISGGGTNNGPAVHVASRATNQATQAAATGTIQSSETWSCWMLAVEPGTKGVGSGSAIAPLSYHHRFHNMSG